MHVRKRVAVDGQTGYCSQKIFHESAVTGLYLEEPEHRVCDTKELDVYMLW